MKKAYTTPKVFDCQQMPPRVKTAWKAWMREGDPVGNRVYVDWHTNMWTGEFEDGSMASETAKLFKIINDWLLSQGMSANEDVLVRNWW